MSSSCPVCAYPRVGSSSNSGEVNCERCGRFKISPTASVTLPTLIESDPRLRYILSNFIYRHRGSEFLITDDVINRTLKEFRDPTPFEQANAMLLHLSEDYTNLGMTRDFNPEKLQTIIGAPNIDGVIYVIIELERDGLLQGRWSTFRSADNRLNVKDGLFRGVVTFKGWRIIADLKKSITQSTVAFMAMQFGDDKLDSFVNDYIRPAVSDTGFRLMRVDDEPKAGLIDDAMRVAIRGSKFLLADISHGNKGAYWEAGFAEGLGKPVIYLCRMDVFNDPAHQHRPHFDTNHHLTIVWNPDDPMDAMRRLKATIRYTLPEAKQID